MQYALLEARINAGGGRGGSRGRSGDGLELRVADRAAAEAAATSSIGEGSSGSDGGGRSDGGSGGTALVGFVKVVAFSSTAPERLEAALRDIAAASSGDSSGSSGDSSGGGALRGLVVDLRDNRGGDVEAGVEAARDLLLDGDVLAM